MAAVVRVIREVKLDVYGKRRQTAKIKPLPSVFSSLYRIKIFVFAVNGKRHFSVKGLQAIHVRPYESCYIARMDEYLREQARTLPRGNIMHLHSSNPHHT